MTRVVYSCNRVDYRSQKWSTNVLQWAIDALTWSTDALKWSIDALQWSTGFRKLWHIQILRCPKDIDIIWVSTTWGFQRDQPWNAVLSTRGLNRLLNNSKLDLDDGQMVITIFWVVPWAVTSICEKKWATSLPCTAMPNQSQEVLGHCSTYIDLSSLSVDTSVDHGSASVYPSSTSVDHSSASVDH